MPFGLNIHIECILWRQPSTPRVAAVLEKRKNAPDIVDRLCIAEIGAMDEAYRWAALIAKPDERRLVLTRSLVLPPSASGRPRYVWSWSKLRSATGMHQDTLKIRWGRGIGHIVSALNKPSPTAWPQE